MVLSDVDHTGFRNPTASSREEGFELLRQLIGTVEQGHGRAVAIANQLIAEFGDAAAALSASLPRLEKLLPDARRVVELFVASRKMLLYSLDHHMRQRQILADDRVVGQYLFAHMAYETAEQVRVLYLDTKNGLLRDDVIASGTVNRVAISPREIIRRALEIGATGLIVAHNHPSGDPRPSASDIVITREIAQATRLFEINLLDHIIIARQGCYSFRSEGLL